jgi:uncharacterized protein (TIGR02246 family)
MIRILLPALLLTVGAAASARAAEPDLTPFRDQAKEFAAAWNKNDAALLAGFWADDGDLIDPHGVQSKGKAAVEKYFAEMFAGPLKGSRNDVKVESVRMLGSDYAVADWTATLSVKSPDGSAHEVPHHVTVVLAKGKGWHVVAARPVFHPPAPGK